MPLLTSSLKASLNRNINRSQRFARDVTYPYLVLLGEKDTIIDNKAVREWHGKTASQVKDLKLIAGSYHELFKEPNNSVMFELVLKFINKRLEEPKVAFG